MLEVFASEQDPAYPWLPPLTLGAVIMTQASSLMKLSLGMGAAAIAGADPAILVSSQATSCTFMTELPPLKTLFDAISAGKPHVLPSTCTDFSLKLQVRT